MAHGEVEIQGSLAERVGKRSVVGVIKVVIEFERNTQDRIRDLIASLACLEECLAEVTT